MGHEVVRVYRAEATFNRPVDNGRSQRVFAGFFQTGGKQEELFFCHTGCRNGPG